MVKRVIVGTLALLMVISAIALADGVGAFSAFKSGIGARTLAMSGAFIAVADDVTAMVWNPQAELSRVTGLLSLDGDSQLFGVDGMVPGETIFCWNPALNFGSMVNLRSGNQVVFDEVFVEATDQFNPMTNLLGLNESVRLDVFPDFSSDGDIMGQIFLPTQMIEDYVPYMDFVPASALIVLDESAKYDYAITAIALADYFNLMELVAKNPFLYKGTANELLTNALVGQNQLRSLDYGGPPLIW